MRNQEVIFGLTGQTLFYDPPEMFQPSGTPTVQVWLATNDDSSAVESATTGACSVDSVATTFSASAGAQSITVASGTGITRGRRYLVTAPNGTAEWIICRSVTGATVELKHPLINTYAASSTLKGCRISISVDSTWVADASNITDILSGTWRTDVQPDSDAFVGQAGYRLRWAYTVNSVATTGVSFADLVRYQAKNLVSALDVEGRFPGFLDRLPTDDRADQGAEFCAEAFHAMRMDAIANSVQLRRVRNTEILRELTMFKANLMSLENEVMRGRGNIDGVATARDLYTQRFDQLLTEPKFPTDSGGGGASAQSPRQSVFTR